MMSKENRLNLGGRCREGLQPSQCSLFIPAGEEIIADEWYRFSFLGILLKVGEAQRQVELVSGALAHPFDADGTPGVTSAHKSRVVLVVEFFFDSDEAAS